MIGVFDSGFGGLEILREIVKKLPQYRYIYLGDTQRSPYGARTQETIFQFTKQGVDFLFNRGCKLIILACNTASAESLRRIQQQTPRQRKVLGVIIPAHGGAGFSGREYKNNSWKKDKNYFRRQDSRSKVRGLPRKASRNRAMS